MRLLFFSVLLGLMLAAANIASAACGARGGPAFRGPDGKCVGWAALDRVCGRPPTTRCAYEGGGVGEQTSKAAKLSWLEQGQD